MARMHRPQIGSELATTTGSSAGSACGDLMDHARQSPANGAAVNEQLRYDFVGTPGNGHSGQWIQEMKWWSRVEKVRPHPSNDSDPAQRAVAHLGRAVSRRLVGARMRFSTQFILDAAVWVITLYIAQILRFDLVVGMVNLPQPPYLR